MKVEVRLFAQLREYLPPGAKGRRALVDVPTASNVRDVARCLGIPEDTAGVTLINGQQAGPDTVLGENDVVSLFPPIAGG